MKPKQRFMSALNFQKPDDYVSFMEIEFQIYEEYIGKTLQVGYELAKMSSIEKERAMYRNAEILIETAEKAGHDVIRNITGYWEISPGEPAYLWLPDEETQLTQLKILKKECGDKYCIMGNTGPTMGIPDGNHIYEFVYDLYEKPDEIKENLEKQLSGAIKWGDMQIEAGADCLVNCADLAFNNGPFISPEMCDEFVFPYMNRWVADLKSKGIPSIWHTDGNIMPIMDRVLESGLSAIQCVDPVAGMDIVELKKSVHGKLALIGNINCADLQFGPVEKIDEEVKHIVEGCKGDGGFVLCGCNAIFKGIPAEYYQVVVEGRYKHGKE